MHEVNSWADLLDSNTKHIYLTIYLNFIFRERTSMKPHFEY